MKTWPRRFIIRVLRGYKTIVSPWLAPACRFTPSCSEFAVDAVEQYGAFRGAARAVHRLLRCHPLSRGGFDPLT